MKWSQDTDPADCSVIFFQEKKYLELRSGFDGQDCLN